LYSIAKNIFLQYISHNDMNYIRLYDIKFRVSHTPLSWARLLHSLGRVVVTSKNGRRKKLIIRNQYLNLSILINR